MDRTLNVKLLRALVIALPVAALAAGCAGRKPVSEIARAEQAVRHAQTTSEAQRYAPVELSAAQVKLASARRAVDDGDYEAGRRLAEQALADAQLAEAKAESQVAREQAGRTRADIEALQAEVASPGTVVIERQRTIQRTTPTTVVVERPAPPAQVVIERREPAVVVIPE